ncbi:MAG: putative FAD-dependent dehydrogenase, partial [Granulosicoccus sp.]
MQTVDLRITAQLLQSEEELKRVVSRESGIASNEIDSFQIIRKSLDARHGKLRFNLRVEVRTKDDTVTQHPDFTERNFEDVSNAEPIIIVGSGPAGLFAALRAIELGKKPVVLERGKNVRDRRRDLAQLNRNHIVNPESNYCYGEGGAGTYSDGKLYTRSTKRGKVSRILSTFIQFGAGNEILVDAHPHIGTDKLPQVIAKMRDRILECGGEIRFDSKMTDLLINDSEITGVKVNDSETISAKSVILATGHSARDVYELLHEKGIEIEQKQFALGVRVEHPQELINEIQYHGQICDVLPAASYSWVEQVRGRGVYSFCMCPGGIIAPCATSPGEVVTNGWSPSKRNNPFANSGVVVSVEQEDLQPYLDQGPLAGMRFQQAVEQAVCESGGGTQTAPAQRLADLVKGKLSEDLPKCSYHPGLVSRPLSEVLPTSIISRLTDGFRMVGKKMNGYMTNEAVAVAVESRTSSPVRIPRGKDGQHPQIKGLYPCGEGAGYAGGIVSAAIDGEKMVDLMVS